MWRVANGLDNAGLYNFKNVDPINVRFDLTVTILFEFQNSFDMKKCYELFVNIELKG